MDAPWASQVAELYRIRLPMQEMQETQVRSPGAGMATLSSILAWEVPWTEEPGGLLSMGSQRVASLIIFLLKDS